MPGPWTVNAGLRWDHYRLLVEQNAWSPRIGVAWSWPGRDLVARASYDRVFQTPATENLLLAGSAVDAAASCLVFATTSGRRLRVQADVLNLTNRLNVINFAGLFSCTAVGPPRGFAVRLQAEF